MVNAPRAPCSQVSLLCGAQFLGHLSPQHEMTGLAVGPCCTAVAHRTFPAAPFAASAGDRSMDACARGTTPRTTTPITVRRGVMMPPPHSPREYPLSASGRPATSELGVPGRTTAVRRTGRWRKLAVWAAERRAVAYVWGEW